jgi:hypothetical protein
LMFLFQRCKHNAVPGVFQNSIKFDKTCFNQILALRERK